MIFKVVWSIVADGTLFKGAFAVSADDDDHAIERAREALGREGSAASFYVKDNAERCLELGRHEYPAHGKKSDSVPHVEAPHEFKNRQRYVFDIAARANVIAEDKDGAAKRMGHALTGKDVGSVKFLRTTISDQEPYDDLSQYERHLLEKQFRSVRVSST